jgi:LL-diaminopimelate aminotransferase
MSLLQVDGARERTIEFHSLSKTFNMTGWRIGFACGSEPIVAALGQVKSNCDSGQFNAIQMAGREALDHYDHADVRSMLDIYRERRNALCDGLAEIGCDVPRPKASFFVWGRVPAGYDSMAFAEKALEEADVVLIPGKGFAPHCDQFFRAALTVEVERIEEAIERLKKVDW